MKKTPRNEQETILIYTVELDEWEIYSNYPVHIRRYRDKVIPDREEFYSDGSEAVLAGKIEGSVGVSGKRNITDKQRKEMSKRMKKVHSAL